MTSHSVEVCVNGLVVDVELEYQPPGIGQRGEWGWSVADVRVDEPEDWPDGTDPWQWVTSAEGEAEIAVAVDYEIADIEREGRESTDAYDGDYRRCGWD